MSFIIAALIGEFCFMALSICSKRLRNHDVSVPAIMAISGLTVPVWMGAIIYFYLQDKILLSFDYVLVTIAWLVTTAFLSFGGTFLQRFQSLSEAAGYRFGLSLVFASLVDLLFFMPDTDPRQFIAVALCFIGGYHLTIQRNKQVSADTTISNTKKFTILIFLSGLEIATYSTYKLGIEQQDNPFVHLCITHAFLITGFFFYGFKSLKKDFKEKQVPVYIIPLCCLLFLMAASADTWALSALPVSVFVLFLLIRTCCFALHDIYEGELEFKKSTVASIILILTGIVYASILQL